MEDGAWSMEHGAWSRNRGVKEQEARWSSRPTREREKKSARVVRADACRVNEVSAEVPKPLTVQQAKQAWAHVNPAMRTPALNPTCKAHAPLMVAEYNEYRGKLMRIAGSRPHTVVRKPQ